MQRLYVLGDQKPILEGLAEEYAMISEEYAVRPSLIILNFENVVEERKIELVKIQIHNVLNTQGLHINQKVHVKQD